MHRRHRDYYRCDDDVDDDDERNTDNENDALAVADTVVDEY